MTLFEPVANFDPLEPLRRALESRQIRVWLAICGLTAIWFAALVLLIRALAGALTQPLSSLTLISLGLLAAAIVQACRMMSPGNERRLSDYALRAGLVVFALALSLPGGSALGLSGLWAIVAAGEFYALRSKPTAMRTAPQELVTLKLPKRPRPGVRFDPPQVPAPHLPAEDVVQQLIRRTTSNGDEILEGYLRVQFEAGQRHAVAHVSFCPPFEQSPEISIEQVDGPHSSIKAGQSMPHGVRIECSLIHASNLPQKVLLSIMATLS